MAIKRIKYKILLTLFLICLISSIILSLPKFSSKYCPLSEKKCDIVHNSKYNYFLGIQNSYYGILIFTFLSILTYFQIKKPDEKKKKIISLATIIGSVVATYFLYLQKFVLNAYCEYCVLTDISMIIALIVVIWRRKE